MMNIKPSAAIRKNYNEISELCKRSGEPVYLTKNGKGDLVVMDIETFARRESMLRLRENLVAAEEGRLNGKPGHSIETVFFSNIFCRQGPISFRLHYFCILEAYGKS